jgi:DNA-binding Lrp family transcriptional regulator
MATREVTTLPEATALDGIDATILTALAPTQHVYQPLPALHARSGVPVDDLRRRLQHLERAGYVHRLRTDVDSLQDHYCLSTAGQACADALSG